MATSKTVAEMLAAIRALEPALREASAALDTWASEAATFTGAWASKTAAQKDAAAKLQMERFGTLCSRLADLLRHQGLGD